VTKLILVYLWLFPAFKGRLSKSQEIYETKGSPGGVLQYDFFQILDALFLWVLPFLFLE
jgi:hypothetical protein